jgi:hypothetical protein
VAKQRIWGIRRDLKVTATKSRLPVVRIVPSASRVAGGMSELFFCVCSRKLSAAADDGVFLPASWSSRLHGRLRIVSSASRVAGFGAADELFFCVCSRKLSAAAGVVIFCPQAGAYGYTKKFQ